MRKLLLNTTPLFRKLRQLSLLLTLLLALPQTVWGQTTYDKGTYNSQDNTWGNWQVAASNTTVSSSGQYLAFDVVDNTTATITLTLTNPGNTSEKICRAYFSYNQDSSIPDDNKVKLLSAKIVDTNNSESDLTNDFNKAIKSCTFNAKTPVEWSTGDKFVVTLQVHNTTGATTNHSIQAAELKTGTPYGLIVNGITVTNVNQNSVTNKEKYFDEQQHNVDEAVFTPEEGSNPATLTLTLADFDVSSASIAAIESSLGSLKVILAGANTITCGNNKAFNLADNSSLTITTNGTNSGQLTITSTSAITTESFYSPSSATVTYQNSLVATNPTSTSVLISPPTSYDITIAGVAVTNANASAITGTGITGTVSFDAANNILTLNGATINGNINYNGTTDFTIALNGSNSIVNTNGNYAIVTNTTTTNSLKFEKATNASTAELALEWATGDKAISANDSILGNGLYWKPIAATQMNITDNPEFVIVGDYAIPDGTTVNGSTSGTITYNATDKLLTISSFSETYDKDAIRTGVSGLKVKLVGESVITCNTYDKGAFTAFTTSASIQFVKNDANSKLTMSTTLDPLYGFAAGAITYDELYYYYAGSNQYIIRPKNSPTIKFVVRDQTAGSIPASQSDYVYVPDNGIQIPYAASYYAPKPVFSDDYQLSDSTRYEYTMSVDGVVQFALGGTTQGNPGKIAYADNGEVSIKKTGMVTITCSFPGNMQNNPCSASYTLQVDKGNATFEYQVGTTAVTTSDGYIDVNGVGQWGDPNTGGGSAPALTIPSGATAITYTSSDTNVATVTTTGTVTPVGPGQTTITATMKDDDCYNDATASYELTVKVPATISFANATASVLNTATYTQAATTDPAGATITYESSNNNVSVDANGQVTINNQSFYGPVTITATLTAVPAATPQLYYVLANEPAFQASYTLNVAKNFDISSIFTDASMNYATCILSEQLTKPDGLKVYYITGTNGNTVTTQEIDYLPYGIPILLEKTAATIGSVTARTDSSSVVSGNILQYATSNVNTTGSQYILYKNEFVKATGTILSGSCYLQISTNLPARGVLGIGNDGSTAIEGIDVEATEDKTWYDLQGRRIQKPTKAGIYIVNGKKMIINNK